MILSPAVLALVGFIGILGAVCGFYFVHKGLNLLTSFVKSLRRGA